MKKYNITVNGNTYEVLVEEADASTHVAYTAPPATGAAVLVAALVTATGAAVGAV